MAALAAAGLLAALAAPAAAAPTATVTTKVYQLPCKAEVCGSGDRQLASGSLVRDAVQIQVTARSSIGIDHLRLEASTGSRYDCWEAWSFDGVSSTTQTFRWDTSQWPVTCNGGGGNPTRNVKVTVRAVAVERANAGTYTSSAFAARVNNRPTTPEWVAQPRAVGPEDGGPFVELSWYASPEPDIAEYHYVRIGPSGDEVEFAVSASDPGSHGCSSDGDSYSCVDRAFGEENFGGRYTYLLIAYRESPSDADSCALSGNGCVQSAASPARNATLHEPRPPEDTPPPTTTRVLSTGGKKKAAKRGPRPVGNGTSYASLAAGKYWKEGEYSSTLPYGDQTLLSPADDGQPPVFAAGPVASSRATPQGRDMWVFLAGGLMALVLAGHVARLARDPAR